MTLVLIPSPFGPRVIHSELGVNMEGPKDGGEKQNFG